MKRVLYFSTIAIIFFTRCEELKEYGYPVDNIPPGIVTDINVENLPGGARITYTLPSDNDLLGVKAVYFNTRINMDSEVFSSAYRDTIELSGFHNIDKVTVKLITIDISKNESQPVEVQINPLPPPVEIIRSTLSVESTFGGVFVTWINEFQENIGIELSASDKTGDLKHNYTYFSNSVAGKYTFRGFDDSERRFKLNVVDRWGQYSIPLDTILKPLSEEYLSPLGPMQELKWEKLGENDGTCLFRGDANQAANHTHAGRTWVVAFDGTVDPFAGFYVSSGGNYLGLYTKKSEDMSVTVFPAYATFDFNDEYFLSRHKLWHWSGNVLSDKAIKKYEIWATREIKPVDISKDIMESLAYWTGWAEVGGTDAWKEDWDLIAVMDAIPPSGANSISLITEDDRTWARTNGFETNVNTEFTSTPYRYFRIVFLESWSDPLKAYQVGEWEFYGQKYQP